MEYTINDMAKMAGISTRTLRYYDEIGLLKPRRISSNGYRIYGKDEINKLQQILFYREFDMKLLKILEILTDKDYDRERILRDHRRNLMEKRKQIDLFIRNLDESIDEMEGRVKMKDKDKFQGFKEKLVRDNEEKYGKEIREKYGDQVIEDSNKKMMGQTKEQFEQGEELGGEILVKLYQAMDKGDPSSKEAQEVARLHHEWLMLYWPAYSKEAHMGLAMMYVEDEGFRDFYDQGKEGAADFLRRIIEVYTS